MAGSVPRPRPTPNGTKAAAQLSVHAECQQLLESERPIGLRVIDDGRPHEKDLRCAERQAWLMRQAQGPPCAVDGEGGGLVRCELMRFMVQRHDLLCGVGGDTLDAPLAHAVLHLCKLRVRHLDLPPPRTATLQENCANHLE